MFIFLYGYRGMNSIEATPPIAVDWERLHEVVDMTKSATLDFFAKRQQRGALDQKIQSVAAHIDWLKFLLDEVSGIGCGASLPRVLPLDDFCQGVYGTFLDEDPRENLRRLQKEQEELLHVLQGRKSDLDGVEKKEIGCRRSLSDMPQGEWVRKVKEANFCRTLKLSREFFQRLSRFFLAEQCRWTVCLSPCAFTQWAEFSLLVVRASDYFMLRSFVETVYSRLKEILCQMPLACLEKTQQSFELWLQEQQDMPASLVACFASLIDETLLLRRHFNSSDFDRELVPTQNEFCLENDMKEHGEGECGSPYVPALSGASDTSLGESLDRSLELMEDVPVSDVFCESEAVASSFCLEPQKLSQEVADSDGGNSTIGDADVSTEQERHCMPPSVVSVDRQNGLISALIQRLFCCYNRRHSID